MCTGRGMDKLSTKNTVYKAIPFQLFYYRKTYALICN